MKHTMTIFIDGESWMVLDSSMAVREIMGTDTFPLPFTKNAPASMVIDTLKRLNPNATIVRRSH